METLTCWGETKSIREWERDPRVNGLRYQTLHQRKKKLGWSDEKVLTEPLRRKGDRDVPADSTDLLCAPELPPFDLSDVERVLEQARGQRLKQNSQARLRRIVELERKHVEVLKSLETWRARTAVVAKQRCEAIKRRDELKEFQEYIAAAEYLSVKRTAEKAIASLSASVDKLEAGLKAVEKEAASIRGELELLKGVMPATPVVTVPIVPAVLVAAPVAVRSKPQTPKEWHRHIDRAVGEEWDRIRSLRAEIELHAPDIDTYGSRRKTEVVHRLVSMLVGKQRQLMSELVDPLAKEAAFVCGGRLSNAARSYLDPRRNNVYGLSAGHDAPPPQQGWTAHIAEQEKLLASARAAADRPRPTTEDHPMRERVEVEVEVEAKSVAKDESDEGDPELKRLEGVIAQRARPLKLAVFGGSPVRNAPLADWMEQTLKFAAVRWHEQATSAVQSLKAGGADVLVLLLKDVGHGETAPVTGAAKAHGIPIAFAESTSKAEFARKIAQALGINK